ncbi:hypothetical protein QLX67_04570 [Balneolaceae bacterium ANBcel3]|nr:hypothetical protein [Balneolaceae bacterium ANBcel3]
MWLRRKPFKQHSLFFILPVCILFSGLISVHEAAAQSRTEEAKDRMDGKSGTVSNTLSLLYHVGVEPLQFFFYFKPAYHNEPRLSYNPYPYQHTQSQGIRNFEEAGRRGVWDAQATFSLPQTSVAMSQLSARIKRNQRYWGFILGYEYMKEEKAPFGIHQGEYLAERKFRFMPNGDGGLQFGMRSIHMDGDAYVGPSLGVQVEVFPFRPFSLGYMGNATHTKHADVINHELHLGIHIHSSRFFFRQRWLNIGGIHFRTLTAGAGLYF